MIEAALRIGRNAKAIWQDLVSYHGFTAAYASVKRFARKLRGTQTPEESGVIVTAPGREAQVDYGEGPMVRDPDTKKNTHSASWSDWPVLTRPLAAPTTRSSVKDFDIEVHRAHPDAHLVGEAEAEPGFPRVHRQHNVELRVEPQRQSLEERDRRPLVPHVGGRR